MVTQALHYWYTCALATQPAFNTGSTMANTRGGHHKATATPRHVARSSGDLPLLAIALTGVLLTAYLSFMAGGQGALAFCDAGSGCDVVQSSRWSTLLGLPLAAWGCMTYAALGLATWRLRAPQTRWRAQVLISFSGLAISMYLTLVALTQLRAACAWCLLSLVLWAAAAALTWRRAPVTAASNWRLTSAGLAGVALIVLHLHYAGVFNPAAGPEDPHQRAVADALTATGAKFYGAEWCPHCQQQKALFSAAGRHLPYVECAPNGPQGAQATECVAHEIKGYPTWIINGNRYQRTLSVKQLALMSGVKLPAP